MIAVILFALPLLALLAAWLWPSPRDEGDPIPNHWTGSRQSTPWHLKARSDALAGWYQERWDSDPFSCHDDDGFDPTVWADPLARLDDGRLTRHHERESRRSKRAMRAELRAEFYRLAESAELRDQGMGVMAALVGVPIETARGWWALGVREGRLKPYHKTAQARDNDAYRWTPAEAGRRFGV